MKFSGSSKELLSTLQKLAPVMSGKKMIPILDCVLFDGEAESLLTFATDLETSLTISETKDWIIEKHGKCCLPYKMLTEILKKMNGVDITIEVDGDRAVLTHKSGRFDFMAVEPSDYPEMPKEDSGNMIPVQSQVFVNSITRAARFVSKDEYKPMLCGVLVEVEEDGNIAMVGTDAMHLGVMNLISTANELQGTHKPYAMSGIIPTKAIAAIKSAIRKDDDVLFISIGDRFSYINDGSTIMAIRLVAQKYPNYKSIMPVLSDSYAVVDKTRLVDAVSRVMAFAGEFNIIKFYLADGEIEITSDMKDFGRSASEKVAVDYSGAELFIKMNGEMFINAISSFNDVEIEMFLTDEKKPMVLVGSDSTCLVMPTAGL